MTRPTIIFFVVNLILFCFCAANAQEQNQQTDRRATPEDIANADVVIVANVRAKELKFEVVPNTNVEFPGTGERKTFWKADRQNLPTKVEPGVTYRNIGIQLRIISRFADIERIVAEALGEIPVSENAAPPVNQSQPTPPDLQAPRRNEPAPLQRRIARRSPPKKQNR